MTRANKLLLLVEETRRRILKTMPETTVSPKRTFSLSAPASTRSEPSQCEKSLARCLRRRFQTYSQLPIRCQRPSPYYRPPRTTFRLPALVAINRSPSIAKSSPDRSTCTSIFRVIGTPRCKKSLSMIDLSPTTLELENGDLRSESSSTLERLEEVGDRVKEIVGNDVAHAGVRGWPDGFVSSESDEGSSQFFQNPKKAASLLCRVLMLNAWRRRRAEIVHLRDTIDNLSQQVEHLHLQIVVLRRLLESENTRVGRINAEAHRTKSQLDEALRERDGLRVEKEKMDEELKRLVEVSEERLVITENVRNELLSAQNQLRSLDEQISRDREKLLQLREDKRMLLEKVTSSEAVAAESEARAEKAESDADDLQLSLAAQIALVESSREEILRYSNDLKARQDEKLDLEERLRNSEEVGRSLNLRTAFLEQELADREADLRRVESAYNSQLMELNDLRERLVRQSQEGGWSSRMLQIAGSVVRAPRAILRTLSLLSSSGSPMGC